VLHRRQLPSLELATNNDFGYNAPTGTVTFIDSTGIITGHCNNEAVTPQKRLLPPSAVALGDGASLSVFAG
jgi:hypothetical protein